VSPEQATAPPNSPEEATPDDANDLRGFHFRRLMGKPLTWIVIAIFVAVAGVVAAIYLGAAIGAGAAVAMLLISLLVAFAIADSKAEDAFFETYAAQRGLALLGKSPLPPATPLLRKGDDRYAERALTGSLAEGVDGVLALYTYEDETTDSEGNRETNYYRYTLREHRPPPGALLPAQVGTEIAGEAGGRLPPLQATGQAGERGARQALRDLLQLRAGPGLAAPLLLPHLHRLARRGSAEEVRLRVGWRHPLLLRQRPQEERRRP